MKVVLLHFLKNILIKIHQLRLFWPGQADIVTGDTGDVMADAHDDFADADETCNTVTNQCSRHLDLFNNQ